MKIRFAKTILVSAVLAGMIALGSSHYQTRPHVIEFSPGGVITDFIERYDDIRRSGRPVIIDSLCLSACTLVIGLVPNDRICVTPYAQLGFHSAWFQTMLGPAHSSEGTRLVWQIYPREWQELLRKRGWDGGGQTNKHMPLIYVSDDDLRALIRAC